MKFNTPLPQPLPKECLKAAKIFKSFVDSGNNGLDGVIPRQVLEHAKGFAIFTIIKAGLLFSARAGSGIVIAKLEDGTWSAPSAIGSAGLGVGGQAGAEVTDFLVVLNSRSAVRSFMSAGSLTLGGNMSIALGPLGRNGEALGSLNTSGKVAAMYSYSKTRGFFGGVSIEGSVIVERQDANSLAYHSDVTVKQLLSGAIEPPEWAQPLIKTLEACVGMPGGHKWVDDSVSQDGPSSPSIRDTGYAFGGGLASPGSELPPSLRKKKGGSSSPFPPVHWGRRKSGGSYFNPNLEEDHEDQFGAGTLGKEKESRTFSHSTAVGNLIEDESVPVSFATRFESDYTPPSPATTSSPFSRSAHRPTLSLHSQTPHSSTYNPGSPFNDLPPFPNMSKNSNALSHNRSVSTASFLNPGTRLGSNSANVDRPNPFVSQAPDPFAYESNGDSIDDYEYDRPRSTSTSGNKPRLTPKAELSLPMSPHEGVGRAIALFDFKGVELGDLAFNKGQVIIITKKTNKTDDWWSGKIDGREGIFPANFVEVV